MQIFLSDENCREELYPFTATRHVADIRVGILTIREKWMFLSGGEVITTGTNFTSSSEKICIGANIIPTENNFQNLISLATSNQVISDEEKRIISPWHIFQLNDWAIRQDYHLLTNKRESAQISASNRCQQPQNIFIEEGGTVEHALINATAGPVYIGKNAEVMEGCMIRGPFAMGDGSVLKMGTKVYGGTTLGPWCVAGGEIKNSVLFGYSNKAHDGYLGDSVIGEWCNLGAGTSNSNVKNTGGTIIYKVNDKLFNAGNKAGLLMGDYSRAAINTSFNTGTLVGICCNIFGGQPPKFVPDFTWGSERYQFEKIITDINNWKKMKNQEITETEIKLLTDLYLKQQQQNA